jgi:hypothetical protein
MACANMRQSNSTYPCFCQQELHAGKNKHDDVSQRTSAGAPLQIQIQNSNG